MKTLQRSILHLGVLLPALALWAGCDGNSDTAGNLSGTVREAGSQMPLADVRVALGDVEATTGADGRYALRNVPVGPSLTVRATAAGFDTYTQHVAIREGENTHDIALVRKAYYSDTTGALNVGVYLTPGVSTYRAVLFLVPPGDEDWRGFASGHPVTVRNPSTPQMPALVAAFVSGLRERALRLAEAHGVALMGAERPDFSEPYDDVLEALERIADQSEHPELAEAPLLFVGASAGGYFAYHFTRRYPERVVGFMSMKGGGHQGGAASPATLAVPGYFFIGELDTPERRSNIMEQFEVNRALGARWALAVEPGAGHAPPDDLDLFEHWMDAVLAARLPEPPPPGAPVTLNTLDETSGWLGNRETFEIDAYDAYVGDPREASWLPTMETAQDWQAFVGGGN